MREKTSLLIFWLMIIGGIGGCAIAQYTEEPIFGQLSTISFLPFVNLMSWQWIDSRSWAGKSKLNLKIFLVLLSFGISIGVFLDFRFTLIAAAIGAALCWLGIPALAFLREERFSPRSIIGLSGFVLLCATPFLLIPFENQLTPILTAVGYLLMTLMYVSVGILGWAYWMRRDLELTPLFNIKILNNWFFGIFAFFALVFIFQPGFERALFFLPESWGSYNEDGEWSMWSENISIYLSYIGSGLVLAAFFNAHERRLLKENKSKI